MRSRSESNSEYPLHRLQLGNLNRMPWQNWETSWLIIVERAMVFARFVSFFCDAIYVLLLFVFFRRLQVSNSPTIHHHRPFLQRSDLSHYIEFHCWSTSILSIHRLQASYRPLAHLSYWLITVSNFCTFDAFFAFYHLSIFNYWITISRF